MGHGIGERVAFDFGDRLSQLPPVFKGYRHPRFFKLHILGHGEFDFLDEFHNLRIADGFFRKVLRLDAAEEKRRRHNIFIAESGIAVRERPDFKGVPADMVDAALRYLQVYRLYVIGFEVVAPSSTSGRTG